MSRLAVRSVHSINVRICAEGIEEKEWLLKMKEMKVDYLHVVGDIFDRGPSADRIIDELMQHHSVDIQWGNHDILWMGAVCGSSICVANVIYNNIKCQNTQILENGYGIALRNLTIFADRTYKDTDPMKSAVKAIAVIMFKLEGQVIKRHPEYDMNDRLLLDKIDMENGLSLDSSFDDIFNTYFGK